MTNEQVDQVHHLYVVSGSIGTSGEQLTRKVMSQFRRDALSLKVVSHVTRPEQIDELLEEATQFNSTIIDTLVNRELAQALKEKAAAHDIVVIDIVGSFIDRLSAVLGHPPSGRPGLYRDLHAEYFRRVEAIDYTLAHDDGKQFEGWAKADVVLVGVSRVGKTPLSMYLAMLGWKVANVPVAVGMEPRAELYKLDHRKVVGLTIEPGQLLSHRKHRREKLGISSRAEYYNLEKLYEEVEYARKLCRRGGFRVFNVTNVPVEASADKIVKWVTRH